MRCYKPTLRYTPVLWCMLLSFILVFASCTNPASNAPASPATPTANEALSGGTETVFDDGVDAFTQVLPNISDANAAMHERGDFLFESQFVPAPASVNPGLGPLFNSDQCSSCHINDGSGRPPLADEQLNSMLFRISIPGTDPHGGPNPVPGFGGQLQQRSVFGVPAEAQVQISYSTTTHSFDDGTTYQLSAPTYSLVNPYIPLPAGVMVSPRIAPPVFGLGLLESIPDSEILNHAGAGSGVPGISGTPNWVWDQTSQTMRLGRFGWKAGQPSLIQQAAGALKEDMGLTNPIFPIESCHGQIQFQAAVDSAQGPEISADQLRDFAGYAQTLAVPARRNVNDPIVQHGELLFKQAQCSACHTPTMTTGENPALPELSNQTIHPYTDLLLHDMGPGLADNRPEFSADGQQWRTPPLWGLGLTQIATGTIRLLHDGRAHSIMEAIMWHGGEAENAKNYVSAMSASDREALIKFLESL